MRTMVAHAVARVALNALDRVHDVVAVRILELVEARNADGRTLVAAAATLRLSAARSLRRSSRRRRVGWGIAGHHAAAVRVERSPVVEEPVAGIELVADDLLALEDAVAVGVEQDARRAAVPGAALRHDGPAETVERDDDERLGLIRRRDPLNLEARKQGEGRAGGERLILRALL